MRCATLLLLLAAALGARAAEDPHAHHKHHHSAHADQTSKRDAGITLLDLPVEDQDERILKFKSEVLNDKIVAINFVFTNCTAVCPVQSAILSKVQHFVQKDLGAEVALVSVSVDPRTDTPARLKAYAKTHDAKTGWSWVTGNKSEIDQILVGLKAYTPNYIDHPAMILVGDAKSGAWTRFNGFPEPERIAGQIRALLAARRAMAKPH